MAKKRKYDDDDIENVEDFESENDNYIEELQPDESEIPDTSGESLFSDDDVEMEIVIEISEDESFDTSDVDVKTKELEEDIVLSKHKLQGKHALKYDSIFKGKSLPY